MLSTLFYLLIWCFVLTRYIVSHNTSPVKVFHRKNIIFHRFFKNLSKKRVFEVILSLFLANNSDFNTIRGFSKTHGGGFPLCFSFRSVDLWREVCDSLIRGYKLLVSSGHKYPLHNAKRTANGQRCAYRYHPSERIKQIKGILFCRRGLAIVSPADLADPRI